MSRYNAWQNKQITPVVRAIDEAELTRDRGVFFGSIQATLNHLLWGDTVWMSRICADVKAPAGGIEGSVDLWTDIAAWSADRFRLDGRIMIWSQTIRNVDLNGELSFYSSVLGRDVTASIALCVTHMFNHQTHHRGQLHAMLTAIGAAAPVSDLFIMPEEF